jgi:hypothetical protein
MLVSLVILLTGCLPSWAQQQQPQEPAKPQAADVSLTGAWTMTVVTQQGEMVSESTIAQDKETLKVVMTGPDGTTIEGPGTVKEGAVQWTITFDTPNGAFTIVFAGKIADADTMAGDMHMGDFGSSTWSAKRKKQ